MFAYFRFTSSLATYILSLILDPRLKSLSLNIPKDLINQMKANQLILDSFGFVDDRANNAHLLSKIIIAELNFYEKYREIEQIATEKKDEYYRT